MIHTIKVWEVNTDPFVDFVFALSALFFVIAVLCGIELYKRLRKSN